MKTIKRIIHSIRTVLAIYRQIKSETSDVMLMDELEKILIESRLVSMICKCSGVSVEELQEQKKYRKKELVAARQIHMAILRVVFKKSLNKSGEPYDKDHATVLHSVKTVKNLVETNSVYRRRYRPVFERCLKLDPTTANTLNLKYLIN